MPKQNLSAITTASIKYFDYFPAHEQQNLKSKLLNTPLNERHLVFSSSAYSLQKIEELFRGIIVARNNWASEQGYSNYLNYWLGKYGIPESQFKDYLENVTKSLEICQRFIPKSVPDSFFSEYNFPCFICSSNTLPFNSIDEAKNYFLNKNERLKGIETQIKFTYEEADISSFNIDKEKSLLNININTKNNINHQIADLFHELSHLVTYLEKKDFYTSNQVFRELETLKTEQLFYKSLSHDSYSLFIADLLITFRRVMFEMEIYNSPNQNYTKLFAVLSNRCFRKTKQEQNPLYLFDDLILYHPLINLPHAIAQTIFLKTI